MSGFRTPEIPRQQMVLWEQRLEDALPPDHAVRLLDMLLCSRAFAKTFKDWESEYDLTEGKPPYHPRDLAALYIYGTMNRLRSSRQQEMACYMRLDVIWLMSGQHPDHATIAGFVARHGKRLRQLYRDVLAVAMAAGLARLEHVAYDGTKIAADAGKGSVQKQEELEAELRGVEQRLEALEREWQENERREQSLWGNDFTCATPSSESLPKRLALMQDRQARLQQALKNIARRVEASTHSEKPKTIASATDPDSRVMPSKEGGSRPNYNAQIGVDAPSGLIVAADVCDEAEDSAQLVPLLEQTQQNVGALPREVSADGNYASGPNLAALEEKKITGYLPSGEEQAEQAAAVAGGPAPEQEKVPLQLQGAQAHAAATPEQWAALPKNSKGCITKESFVYDSQSDVYSCPMGQTLTYRGSAREEKNYGTRLRCTYTSSACGQCPHWQECCKNPKSGRTVKRDEYDPQRERLRARMATPEAQARYQVRKETVERRFGLIKHVLGVRRFMHRGLEAVRTEWMIICTAVNLGVLLREWAQVRLVL